MELLQFNKNELISELFKSKHGKLMDYVKTGLSATKFEPEFFAHLITWNLIKGEIKDTKVALPVIALRQFGKNEEEFAENAIASLMTLDPTNLLKAYNFNKELVKLGLYIDSGNRRKLESALKNYLKMREANFGWWTRAAVQHRRSLKALYAVSHHKAADFAQQILFERNFKEGSIFEKISKLKHMDDLEAAGTILNYKIPFQIAISALGRTKKELQENPAFLLALMDGMSGQQLINNTKFLDNLGVFENPMLGSEYSKAVERAKKDKKVTTLKAGKAMSVISESAHSEDIIKKLSEIQEVKIQEKGIEGDWLILGDCSGSMEKAIEVSKDVASYLTKSVKGRVYLVFFNYAPRLIEVTGMKLEQIKEVTKYIRASGGTSVGCGLKFLLDQKISVSGIAIISDGGDNTSPKFHQVYPEYVKKMDIEPSVYFFHIPGEKNTLSTMCKDFSIHVEKFEMSDSDYYSLPNIIPTMKTARYSLIDEIMNIPLLTFEKVFQPQMKRKED